MKFCVIFLNPKKREGMILLTSIQASQLHPKWIFLYGPQSPVLNWIASAATDPMVEKTVFSHQDISYRVHQSTVTLLQLRASQPFQFSKCSFCVVWIVEDKVICVGTWFLCTSFWGLPSAFLHFSNSPAAFHAYDDVVLHGILGAKKRKNVRHRQGALKPVNLSGSYNLPATNLAPWKIIREATLFLRSFFFQMRTVSFREDNLLETNCSFTFIYTMWWF